MAKAVASVFTPGAVETRLVLWMHVRRWDMRTESPEGSIECAHSTCTQFNWSIVDFFAPKWPRETTSRLLYSVSQKTIHLNSDHNFGKCKPIYKILSPSDFWGNCVDTYCVDTYSHGSSPDLNFCFYTTLWNFKIIHLLPISVAYCMIFRPEAEATVVKFCVQVG